MPLGIGSPFNDLAEEQRWVAWHNELRGGKPAKVPYAPNGKRAKADDSTTWGTRLEAEACAAKIMNGGVGGIGIELGDLGGDAFLAGIDLDSCIGEYGVLAAWAARILNAAYSYTEVSPSGRGLKVFFYVPSEEVRPFLERIGADPQQWGVRRDVPGQDAREHGPAVEVYFSHRYFAVTEEQWGVRRDVPGQDAREHGPAVEVYFSHRYFAVTEEQWPTAPNTLAMLDHKVLDQLAVLIPSARSHAGRTGEQSPDNSRSAIAFRKGAALRRAGKTFEEMCAALRDDPETGPWCREKGDAHGGRELRRIWEKTELAPPLIRSPERACAE
jgi:hypothetical protein